MARVFEARYPGRCRLDCGAAIEEGDDLVMTSAGAVHAECAELDGIEVDW